MRKILNCEFADGVFGRVLSPDDGFHYFFGYYRIIYHNHSSLSFSLDVASRLFLG